LCDIAVCTGHETLSGSSNQGVHDWPEKLLRQGRRIDLQKFGSFVQNIYFETRKRQGLTGKYYDGLQCDHGGKTGLRIADDGTKLELQILVKGKAVPLQAWSGPEGSRKLRFPDFKTTAQDGGRAVSLTHRPPLPPRNTPGTHFC